MGSKLAGLENDLDLPSFCLCDRELMMGLKGDILRFPNMQNFRT